MKKVYVPTKDELYLMQDMGAYMYQYILVKAIESLIIEGLNLPNKDILKNAYKYLREHPEIAPAICRMYPDQIKYSEFAQNDTVLCQELIKVKRNQDSSIYNLDNLSYFEDGLCVLSNTGVISTTTQVLAEKLKTTPKYRFEYKENSLLDAIFQREIKTSDLGYNQYTTSENLMTIEPAYILTLDSAPIAEDQHSTLSELLDKHLRAYASRYGISLSTGIQYYGKDILTNPNTEVKRLLRVINRGK